MLWFVLVLGLMLAALEWRRPLARLRLARVTTVLVVLAAFALLTSPRPVPLSSLREAALATEGFRAEETSSISLPLFALAGWQPTPSGATLVPDLGSLRRRYPELRTLHVYGHGLSPTEADRVGEVRIAAHPAAPAAGPNFAAAELPSALHVGGRAEIRGRVSGQTSGQRLRLECVGLTATEVPVSEDGRFSLTTAPLPAAGRFLARLSLRDGERELASEQVGLMIAPPVLPRLLVLEASPRLDTAHLKRWYAEIGGSLAAHSQIARQRNRAAELAEARADFAELSVAALAGFDLVLLDPVRLGAFSSSERQALETAITKEGLGLLLLGPTTEPETLSPWPTRALNAADPASPERLVRPRWVDRPLPGQTPLPALPLELRLRPGQQARLTDVQGRPLAASVAAGRGQLGLTLVQESWRWALANEPQAFADYWSGLIEQLARRAPQPSRWSCRPAEGPVPIVHHPLTLEWRGAAAQKPGTVLIDPDSSTPVSLPLAQDPRDPTLWSTTYWPSTTGWHRLRTEHSAAGLDFFVDASSAWREPRAQVRRDFTAGLAARRPSIPAPLSLNGGVGAGWLIALILAGLSFLWIESRLARGPRSS